ncbi:MAG: phosphoribosylaminoimidazolesuccinocarboxamide synthase [Flavobacteriales bacterium]|nr:phosphoribosylaminoimidazolesuccinocarboxamide synthase [Flavobacteriales bacterium]
MGTINQTNFSFDGQTALYQGKVRDVYSIGNDWLVMIASDRISAFDVVLPRQIPYKGQVLNQIAIHFLEQTKHIAPNWFLESPHPNVSIGRRAKPFKVEMVIRGYLSGHAWREYQSGKRTLCGVPMPDGMKESDAFEKSIITPSTKADQGHDMDISREEIIRTGLVPAEQYEVMESYTQKLFEFGSAYAQKQGLILVDTKYEFGLIDDKVVLMDEVHTPDSSRYFYLDSYEANQFNGLPQQQLSKEFVRQWLIENGFQGKEGQKIPEMTDAFVNTVSERYIHLYERLTSETFKKISVDGIFEKTNEALKKYL